MFSKINLAFRMAGMAIAVAAVVAPNMAKAADPIPVFMNSNPPDDPVAAFFAYLRDAKSRALASQPTWVSPIVTTTGRLEQNIRYEQTEQATAQGATTSNFDNGKGFRFIVSDRLELQANPPPLEDRVGVKAAQGTGDWQFTSVRYRVASANAANGDYVLTVYSNFQAPSGSTGFTNKAWIYSPSVAAGKGFGAFDIQANVTMQVPGSHRSTIGDAFVGNIAFQYHIGEYFWPQLEFNTTHYIGGVRSGLTQVFVTPGILFGRFALTPGNNLTVGVGFQQAIVPTKTIFTPALTPTYNHAVIFASRLSF